MLEPALLLLVLAAGAPDNPDQPQWMLNGAVRSRPAGAFVGAEALFDIAPGTRIGAYANYFYYWGEVGPRLEWRYLGGFLVGNVWFGAEPGAFVPADTPVRTTDAPREDGLRLVARARLETNLRFLFFWIYNRLTVEARWRSQPEYDPFRDGTFDGELSGEEAIALLASVFKFGGDGTLWAYVEYTVSSEVNFGLLDARPSAGLIVDELADGLALNLDIYYSTRDNSRVAGWGGQLIFWWRF